MLLVHGIKVIERVLETRCHKTVTVNGIPFGFM